MPHDFRQQPPLEPGSHFLQTILLVDDKPENRIALEAALDSAHIRFLHAGSGAIALKMMLDADVSLVLLDVSMPGMDGYEVVQIMRSTRNTRHIPVIMMTAFLRDEMETLRGYQAGAIEFLTKPVNTTMLRCKVMLFLELDQQKRQLRTAYERLDAQKAYYESMLNAAGEGVIGLSTEGNVKFANPAALSMLHLPPQELLECAFRTFFPCTQEQPGRWEETDFHLAWTEKREIRADEAQFRTINRDPFPVQYTCSPLAGHTQGTVVIFQDITQRKALEAQLRQQATTDHLTGLNNRAGFKTSLLHTLARCSRQTSLMALLLIDLDRFKQVNDTLGHEMGDQLLQAVAERLKRSIRMSDTLARLGGDEFTVILEDLNDVEDAAYCAAKIIETLKRPFTIDTMELVIGASIGIATYPECGTDPVTLMQAADVAMYRAKSDGRNLYHFFTQEMNDRARAKMVLEQSLHHALSENQLLLMYQPQIELQTGRVVGLEALLRWQHPTAGLVAPATFVPLLEETGLILSAGNWIMQAVCEQRHDWDIRNVLDEDCKIAINISPRQFVDENLVKVLRQHLYRYQIDAATIELEMTENMLMQENEQTFNILDQLNRLGVALSIDDFGTGYSSFGYIKRFHLHALKIDKSFIDQLADSERDTAITASIINLAHNLKLKTIAEGVETKTQLDILTGLGCDIIQGFYYSPPCRPRELETFLRERRRATNLPPPADLPDHDRHDP
ncbi:EAL domain-containing protein [Chitinivorax sp. B]|uniref:putative bifunctional diguanylate cyclase/phosphodiesterase n=1 Tax=Chitinivorax sp. B TaxID=2502235 RepID=UPI0010F588BF|nr:EAL domain-containing protein [Chitinivorax sp. B]